MFENIGKKIKVFSKVVAWIGIIFSIVLGIALVIAGAVAGSSSSGLAIVICIIVALIITAIGIVASWISACFTYGFGELIERMQSIDDKLRPPEIPQGQAQPSPPDAR